MDMISRNRGLHSRKKKSEREIARITGRSRNTVAKWLHGRWPDVDQQRVARRIGHWLLGRLAQRALALWVWVSTPVSVVEGGIWRSA